MTVLRHPYLHWALGIALGAVFLYASLEKIWKPADFARIVYRYRLAGPSQEVGPLPANLLAVALPWVEAVTGLLLITGFWRREAALVAAGMLVMFLGAVGYTLYHGIDVGSCGCFTTSGQGRSAGWGLLVLDAGLLAGAMLLALIAPRRDLTAPAPGTSTAVPAG